ncbi:unnamed protein product [Schistosoma curassoni]|uniref:LOB domain-containing protein n=1 Tax=Schistosoma curassoni TaxID=6186 RepID=A0A183K0P9_9TREM|nr:unnamed protein product [Schistosoma curassoni]
MKRIAGFRRPDEDVRINLTVATVVQSTASIECVRYISKTLQFIRDGKQNDAYPDADSVNIPYTAAGTSTSGYHLATLQQQLIDLRNRLIMSQTSISNF